MSIDIEKAYDTENRLEFSKNMYLKADCQID